NADICPYTPIGETVDENGCSPSQLSLYVGLIPDEFNIHSIYPNPFNPITSITYGVPEHTNVQIIIYDLSGKRIETLINEFQTPGYHSVNWNAFDNPSGLYFINLTATDYSIIQKLMLLK
ncbi:MAG: T9SS type A sorting domain-containing protein, partial [Candidatus Marinimicrobia bacterium]|nr:T9SS type A sorting domain-containing protein [Candidatus Neomarinimicrobiota bacterium]